MSWVILSSRRLWVNTAPWAGTQGKVSLPPLPQVNKPRGVPTIQTHLLPCKFSNCICSLLPNYQFLFGKLKKKIKHCFLGGGLLWVFCACVLRKGSLFCCYTKKEARKVLPWTEAVKNQIISTAFSYYSPASKICTLIVSLWMPIFIWLRLYGHFCTYYWVTKFFFFLLKHVFLFSKTGPHASEEKVVHYFIPTFSSFLASLRPAMPRSASTQAGPSNQLSQQSAS